MSELKPCPFCGSKAMARKRLTGYISENREKTFGYTYGVICVHCEAETKFLESETTAKDLWNRRADNDRA